MNISKPPQDQTPHSNREGGGKKRDAEVNEWMEEKPG